jgi:RNA polymerase sigma-70 factor (ECF subfamily)
METFTLRQTPMLAEFADSCSDDSLSLGEDPQTVALCREGDTTAWKKLYEANFDFAYRTAHRLGAPTSEVEDVVHEAFEVAFRKLDNFHHGLFSTWLYRIVANVVSSRLRKRRVRDFFHRLWASGPEETSESPEASVGARQTLERLSEVLRQLSAEKREVFALHELEGLTHEEISTRVGCKVETVRTRLHYARKDFEKLARLKGLSP